MASAIAAGGAAKVVGVTLVGIEVSPRGRTSSEVIAQSLSAGH